MFAFEWDFASGESRLVEATLPIHIVDTHHIDRNLSILTSQKTNRMALIDWSVGREVKAIELADAGYFYGHALYSDDGTKILVPIFQGPGTSGFAIFEFPSLKQIDFIATSRGAAHQAIPLGGDTFFFGTTSDASKPNAFGILNLSSRSVRYIETGFGNSPKKTVVAHMKDCGDHVIANLQEPGNNGYLTNGALISFDKKTETTRAVIGRGVLDFNTDMLSIDFDPTSGYAWITVPYQNRIEVWNVARGSLVKTLHFPIEVQPTAISRLEDRDLVVVTTGHRFFAYNAKSIVRISTAEEKMPHHLLNGGHCAHTSRA